MVDRRKNAEAVTSPRFDDVAFTGVRKERKTTVQPPLWIQNPKKQRDSNIAIVKRARCEHCSEDDGVRMFEESQWYKKYKSCERSLVSMELYLYQLELI